MISVFGLGFVGLTTALGFAELGNKVYGIDVDEERKKLLRKGELPFLEPYMGEVLKKHINNNFIVTDNIEEAIKNSEYVFYCVGTPYGNNGAADLTYLISAIDTTIEAIKDDKFRVLVTKSTIPPSTTSEKIYPYVKSKGDVANNLGVANNPEFLREGHCWKDFMEADRIVLGCNDDKSREMLVKLYDPMNIPIKCVSHSTGEFIKYLSNTLLATLISYSNEMAEVAENIGGIEIAKAFKILHMDKRWNNCNMTSYVYPGCGYGGYCLPKDTNALYAIAKSNGVNAEILGDVIKTNDNMSKLIAKRISKQIDKDLKVGILGLAFKPNSDDVRDSASAKVIKELLDIGYKHISGYDPVAKDKFDKFYDLNIDYYDNLQEIEEQSDVLIILTAWNEFEKIKTTSKKIVLDYRYM